jgi:transcriptional regulator with XRE-family HTH domain
MGSKARGQSDVRGLFAANVKRARANLRLSQLALASKLGMAHNFINDIEHGRKWVSPETIERLCAVLEVQPYQLLLPGEAEVMKKDKAIADCCDEITKRTAQVVAEIRGKYLG